MEAMMTSQRHCTDEELTLFSYQTLSVDEHRRIAQHIDACQGCQRQLNLLQADLSRVLDSPLALSAKERQQFTDRVMHKRSSRRWRWSTFGASLAAAAALLVVVFWQPMSPSTITPQDDLSSAFDGGTMEQAPETVIASFETVEQVEMIDQIELLNNLELLQNMDLLHDISSST